MTLDDFRLCAKKEDALSSNFSSAFSIAFSLIVISVTSSIWNAGIVLGLSASIYVVIFFAIPSFFLCISRPAEQSSVRALLESAGIPYKGVIRVRITRSNSTFCIGFPMYPFILVAREHVEHDKIIISRTTQRMIVHELTHYMNNDYVRFAGISASIAASITSLSIFIYAAYFSGIYTESWVMPLFGGTQPAYLFIVGAILSIEVLLLINYLHEREKTADRITYRIIGDIYTEFVEFRAALERANNRKFSILQITKLLTHPSWKSRATYIHNKRTVASAYFFYLIVAGYTFSIGMMFLMYFGAFGQVMRERDILPVTFPTVPESFAAQVLVSLLIPLGFAVIAFILAVQKIRHARISVIPALCAAFLLLYVLNVIFYDTFQDALLDMAKEVVKAVPDTRLMLLEKLIADEFGGFYFNNPAAIAYLTMMSGAVLIFPRQVEKKAGLEWLQLLAETYFIVVVTMIWLLVYFMRHGQGQLGFGTEHLENFGWEIFKLAAFQAVIELLRRARLRLKSAA